MATIQPKGEKVRQAVRWISAERLEDDNRAFTILIAEAARKYNLSPMEEEYLRAFYRDKGEH
jgi:hypothetical protein